LWFLEHLQGLPMTPKTHLLGAPKKLSGYI
jgi:hypothetical protein